MFTSAGMMGPASAALASLKDAIAACVSQEAIGGFRFDEAAAGLCMANELRALFLPLSRTEHGGAVVSPMGFPSRRLRGGARRVASAVGRASAPMAKAGDPLAFGTPNSAFRRPPLRVAVGAEDEADEEAGRDGPLCSDAMREWITCSPFIGAKPTPPVGASKAGEAAASGHVVRLVHARASTAQRAHTGSDRVVTPARRSTRGQAESIEHPNRHAESARIAALLDATDYAYAPNGALFLASDRAHP